MRIFILLIFSLAIVPFVQSQETPAADATANPPAQKLFSQTQLEQLVAPIALYPDSLLAQVLAASTYPVDVVAAARWIKNNPSLSQDEIKDELKNKKWDPSVQGLIFFPELLAKMNDNLDWTKDLGDAFLDQQKDVLDTVQSMRTKAKEAGTLKSDSNQKVDATEDGQIQIESTDPEVVYVDNYVPSESYGSWDGGGSWYYPQVVAAPAYPWGRYGAGWALAYRCAWNNGNISHYNNNYFADTNRYNKNNLANREWSHRQTAQSKAAPATKQIANQLAAGGKAAAAAKAKAGVESRNLQNAGRSVAGSQSRNNAFGAAKSGAAERAYSNRGYSSRSKSSSAKNRPSSVSRSSGSRGGAARSGGSRGGGSRGAGGGRGGGGRR